MRHSAFFIAASAIAVGAQMCTLSLTEFSGDCYSFATYESCFSGFTISDSGSATSTSSDSMCSVTIQVSSSGHATFQGNTFQLAGACAVLCGIRHKGCAFCAEWTKHDDNVEAML